MFDLLCNLILIMSLFENEREKFHIQVALPINMKLIKEIKDSTKREQEGNG